ncbi:MAG TPA: hypothetical protein ENK91_12595 [Bacteroidetes bacterium]|nr:hypothetical protein [Bacteroidota bacterium]
MVKSILVGLVLLSFLACSEKKPIPVQKKHLDLAQTKTETKTSEEFIPEHIRKSKIEVVKRY